MAPVMNKPHIEHVRNFLAGSLSVFDYDQMQILDMPERVEESDQIETLSASPVRGRDHEYPSLVIFIFCF